MEKGYKVPIDKVVRSRTLTKMSKSRGNVVSIDEVVKGVCSLDSGFEFRNLQGQLVDWKLCRVWLIPKQGYVTRRKEPVFLHQVDNPIPMALEGWSTAQHPTEFEFWFTLLGKYEN